VWHDPAPPRPSRPCGAPPIPLFLRWRVILTVRRLAGRARRRPRRAVALAAVAVAVAGLVVLAVNAPSGTCRLRVAAVPGGAQWACSAVAGGQR
jgi:hypothetical protein